MNYLNGVIRVGLRTFSITLSFLGCILYGCNGYTTDWIPSEQSGSMDDVVSKYEAGFFLSTYLKSGSFLLLENASLDKPGKLMMAFDSDTVCYRYEIHETNMIFYNMENGTVELEFVGDKQDAVYGFWLQKDEVSQNSGQRLYWHFEGDKVEVRIMARNASEEP